MREEAQAWLLDYSEDHDWSESTINKWGQTFNKLNDCLKWGWNENIHKIKENHQQREVLSLDETLRFYDMHTTDMYDMIIKLSITTGARPSEILTLKRHEIDLSRDIITLNHTKTKQNRNLFIQSFLKDELVAYLSKNQFQTDMPVFPYYKDHTKSISVRSLEIEYKKRLEMLNISKKITPYCARHSYLTRMAASVNSLILKELAGHTNINTTEKYIHNNEFILRDAASKDLLFDNRRDCTEQIRKIINDVNALIDSSATLDKVALAQAVVYLQQAIQSENQTNLLTPS